jgi:carbohydrate kinase (thermoresistant glucokinase family)
VIFIICGVSGVGKSTVGALLAERLGLNFYDADDFHSPENKAKMQNGMALNDADRAPWLEAIGTQMAVWSVQGGAVLACSALKESYRQTLLDGHDGPVNWVVLSGEEDLLRARLVEREGHFVGPEMLASQLAIWEPPHYGTHFDVIRRPTDIAADIAVSLE